MPRPTRISNLCLLCGRSAADGNTLCNGEVYHADCYSNAINRIERLEAERANLQPSIIKHQSAIATMKSITYKLKSFFGSYELGSEKHRLALAGLEGKDEALVSELKRLKKQLGRIWDFWPTYPPDWDERAAAVKAAEGRCEMCGAEYGLQVHHRKRIGNGGDHCVSNLRVLCTNCHGRQHRKDFEGRRFYTDNEPSAYGERVKLIRRAIEMKKTIRFRYRKYNGERSTRSIDPQRLIKIGKSLCVEGWCHLRGAIRVFAIKRMRGVKFTARD